MEPQFLAKIAKNRYLVIEVHNYRELLYDLTTGPDWIRKTGYEECYVNNILSGTGTRNKIAT